jgi:hypothetical protein
LNQKIKNIGNVPLEKIIDDDGLKIISKLNQLI